MKPIDLWSMEAFRVRHFYYDMGARPVRYILKLKTISLSEIIFLYLNINIIFLLKNHSSHFLGCKITN
jgi:hypothetical protein